MGNEISVVRDISTITGEIKEIVRQAQNMALLYAIEIGRRLTEAKEMLPHGEWGDWLKTEVNFSQSTANNFMKVFVEYGSAQQSFFGVETNSQALGNLSYTKALRLLLIPAEERESFAEEVGAADMSVRELEAAIKERNDAIAAKESAEKHVAEIEARMAELESAEKNAGDAEAKAAALKAKVDELTAALEAEKRKKPSAPPPAKYSDKDIKEMKESAKKAGAETAKKELQAKLDEMQKAADAAADKARDAERKRAEAETALADAKKALAISDPAVAEFKALFDSIQRTAALLKTKLEAVQDTATKDKLKAALSAFGKTL